MSKSKQTDLEAAIAAASGHKVPQRELADITTGEIFQPRARNHYEENDGVPVAPQVELNRPTIRQRIENLINRDPGALQRYIQEGPPDGSEGTDLELPDDPDAPLTNAEALYLDSVAANLAEQAPLPDDGLPRPQELEPPAAPSPSPGEARQAGDAPGGGSPPASKEPSPAGPSAPPAAAPKPTAPRTVRT